MSKDWKDAHFISQKKGVCQESRKAVKLMRNKWIEIVNRVLKDNFKHVPLHVAANVAYSLLREGAVLVDTNTVDFVTNRKPIQTALGMPLDELSDLIRAKQDGRIVVLPCKVGARIYRIVPDRSVIYPDPPEYMVIWDIFKLQDINNFGKTVFLTKEEAEKALKEVQR